VYGDDIVTIKTTPDVKSIEKIRTKQLPVRRALPEFSKNSPKAKSTPLAAAEMRFIIGKDGRTKYQRVNAKTSEAYADTSIEALKEFLYHPVTVNGSPAEAYEIKTKFSYRLGKAAYNKEKIYNTLKASELKAEKQTSNERIKHAYLHSLYRQHLPKDKKRDLKSNFYWYHKAAKDGNPIAQYELGSAFLVSKKVKTDQGLFWLEHSAQASHSKSQMILGLELISGQRVEANQEQGLAWLEKAAQSYTPAKIEYAMALATIQDETLKSVKSAVTVIEEIDAKTVTDLVSLYEAQAVIYYLSGDQKAYKKANKKLLKQAKKYDLPRKVVSENVINIATGQPVKPLWLSIKTAQL